MRPARYTCRNALRSVLKSAVYALLVTLSLSARSPAETGRKAWLRYAPITEQTAREHFAALPAVVAALEDSAVISSAQSELIRGVRGMLGRTLRVANALPKESAILLGRFDAVRAAIPSITSLPELKDDGFWLKSIEVDGVNYLLITAPNDRGVLYGAMFLLRKMSLAQPIDALNEKQTPFTPLRVVTHADNPDGTVEQGYAGRSIFWDGGHAARDLRRAADYARLLASVGINGVSINSGQADPFALSADFIQEVARIADAFRPWGVQLYVSVDLTSPQALGATPTSDPLDADVVAFWERKTDELYRAIPDLGGFVANAVADGRIVPAIYGRTHADAANALAAPLAAHGGVLFYQTSLGTARDSSDPWSDPALAASKSFRPLDGQFADNVILATELGPLSCLVREPPSPLFGQLKHSNQAVALAIAPECVARHRVLCYLSPAWKEVLDFDVRGKNGVLPVKQLVVEKSPDRPLGGFIAVAGIGRDANWLGHPLAVANLYAFGRLAWNPELASKEIADEWTRQTFGHEPLVVGTVVDLLMRSRRIYENYTAPLGASLPMDGDGQSRPADQAGLGRDRTVATGSGFIGHYPKPVAKLYEALETCPDQLLLFMHEVPYTHVLKSGKTVIEQLYDAHYQGARDAARAVDKWRKLSGHMDPTRYRDVLTRLDYQAGHAQVRRDAACNWLWKNSGVADGQGRVGKHPNRVEAEAMQRSGSDAIDVSPAEAASGGQGVACAAADGRAAVRWKHIGKAGWFNVNVFYFDENDGVSQFRLLVGDQVVDQWSADDTLPGDKPNLHTATRHRSPRIALRPDDELRIEATADAGERAVIDYVEVDPAG
ncbi:MAG: alpha-glucuronidase family glycosyl hydrolase [Pirellulales bacterium]